MKTIFAALAAALTWFNTRGTQIEALKQEVADRDKIIADDQANLTALHATVDAQAGDNKLLNAALEDSKTKLADTTTRAETAEKSLAEVNADIESASGQAKDLIQRVNDNTAIPIQVGENGGVVHDEEHPANNAPAPSEAPAPTETAPVETGSGDAAGAGAGDQGGSEAQK